MTRRSNPEVAKMLLWNGDHTPENTAPVCPSRTCRGKAVFRWSHNAAVVSEEAVMNRCGSWGLNRITLHSFWWTWILSHSQEQCLQRGGSRLTDIVQDEIPVITDRSYDMFVPGMPVHVLRSHPPPTHTSMMQERSAKVRKGVVWALMSQQHTLQSSDPLAKSPLRSGDQSRPYPSASWPVSSNVVLTSSDSGAGGKSDVSNTLTNPEAAFVATIAGFWGMKRILWREEAAIRTYLHHHHGVFAAQL